MRDAEGLDRPRAHDESPLARGTTNRRALRRCAAEESTTDGFEVGTTADDYENGDAEFLVQRMNVDHVEAADGDSLEHDGTDVPAELTCAHQMDHTPCRIRSVALNVAADDAVEPGACAHGADEQDLTAMVARERPVVEADDVHGVC